MHNIISRYLIPLIFLFSFCYIEGQIAAPGAPAPLEGEWDDSKIRYELPPYTSLQSEALLQDDPSSALKVLTFASERSLGLDPGVHGEWSNWKEYRVWRIHLRSPGAFSLGLLCGNYRLAEGVRLFVFDPEQQIIKGAFGAHNNKSSGKLAIGHIPGDEIIVELQVPRKLKEFGEFQISSISHAFLPTGGWKDGRFGRSHACEIDVACEEGEDWWLKKQSVVRIYTSTQWCTGVLVNNTSYDATPYVLTSQHCIDRQSRAESSVFVFNYESDTCFGEDGPSHMSVSGGDSVAVGDSVDFCLVRLSETPPPDYDPYYAGWDLYGSQSGRSTVLHHPMGDVKKISIDEDDISVPESLQDVPNSDLRDYHYYSYWWVKDWEWGVTEGGSSGSPLFNKAGRVIGLLTGGLAACLDSTGFDVAKDRVIYSKLEDDFFTRLDVAWDFYGEDGPTLKRWLDPENTGAKAIQGYHPGSNPVPPRSCEGLIHLYPNPAASVLYLEIQRSGAPMHYLIYDMQGRALLQGSSPAAGQEVVEIGIATLPPGLFLIGVESGEHRYFKHFIKSR